MQKAQVVPIWPSSLSENKLNTMVPRFMLKLTDSFWNTSDSNCEPGSVRPMGDEVRLAAAVNGNVMVSAHCSPTATATGMMLVVTSPLRPGDVVMIGRLPSTLSSIQSAFVAGHAVIGTAPAGSGIASSPATRVVHRVSKRALNLSMAVSTQL